MHQSLGQLLDRAGHGDREAFADFYDLTVLEALRLARVSAREHEVVEDLLLAAYLQAWTHAHSHRSSGIRPIVWLLCLVHAAAASPLDSDTRLDLPAAP